MAFMRQHMNQLPKQPTIIYLILHREKYFEEQKTGRAECKGTDSPWLLAKLTIDKKQKTYATLSQSFRGFVPTN